MEHLAIVGRDGNIWATVNTLLGGVLLFRISYKDFC